MLKENGVLIETRPTLTPLFKNESILNKVQRLLSGYGNVSVVY